MGKIAVTELPHVEKLKIDLSSPTLRYLNLPAYVFTIKKKLKLLLTAIEITHNGAEAGNNKTIRVVHRVTPSSNDPNAGSLEWDFQIDTYTGTDVDVVRTENDFGKIYVMPPDTLARITAEQGDSLIIYWDNTYDATANVVVSFRKV